MSGAAPDERWRLGYRPALDGLRGVAVILVVLFHAQVLGAHAGEVGVTVFFVISGFLITSLLAQERDATGAINLARFYVRRARRLLPALFVMLAGVALFMVVIGAGAQVVPHTWPAVLYVANWVRAGDTSLGLLNHTWTLSVEEQFYVLWPLVLPLVLASRHRRSWLMIAIAGAVVARILVNGGVSDLASRRMTVTVADALLIGCLLAIVFRDRGPWRPPLWSAAAAAGTIAIWTVVPPVPGLFALGLLTVALASAVLIAWAMTSGGPLSWRPLVAIGTISYGLYLWHVPIMYAARDVGWLPNPVMAGALIVVSLGVALVSWRWVEQPLRTRRL